MALNSSHAADGKGVLIYNGEVILVYCKEANLELSGRIGGPQIDVFKGTKRGPIYLTSHRIVFVNKDVKDRFLSFSMPFQCMRDIKLEQPVFGANYLHGNVLSQQGGGWEGDATFKLTFNHGGCIEFGQAMLHATQLTARGSAYAAPPPYVAPEGMYFEPPPAYYIPQSESYYGFVPPRNAFPDYPPPGNVYMYNSPPPYFGIGPPAYPTAPVAATPESPYTTTNPSHGAHVRMVGPAMGGANFNSKEAEAMQQQQAPQQLNVRDELEKLPTYDEAMHKKQN